MSKKRKQSYPSLGMQRTTSQPVQSMPLVVERAPGRPDLMKISMNFAIAAPDLAMYADYAQVLRVRDGVQILFGKLHPLDFTKLEQAIDISFPYLPFVNQLYKSVVIERDGGQKPFIESVQENVSKFGYVEIEQLEVPKEISRLKSFRSNFAHMALYEDDAAIDFFHLDAATMQMIQATAASTGQGTAGVKGVIRVVISPTLLLYFLKHSTTVAQELIQTVSIFEESPTVKVRT